MSKKKDPKPVPGPAYYHARTCSSCKLAQFGKPNEYFRGGKKQMGLCFVVTGLPPEKPAFPAVPMRGVTYSMGGYQSLQDLVGWRRDYERSKGRQYSRIPAYPTLEEYLKLASSTFPATLSTLQENVTHNQENVERAKAAWDGEHEVRHGGHAYVKLDRPNSYQDWYPVATYEKWLADSEKDLSDFKAMVESGSWRKLCVDYYVACDSYHGWWVTNWPNVRLAHRNVCCDGWQEGDGRRDTYAKSIASGNRTLHAKDRT